MPLPAPKELKDAVVQAYKRGVKITDIAAQFNVNTSSVNKWTREAGVKKRYSDRKEKSERFKANVVNAYIRGEKLEVITLLYGVAQTTIHAWATAAGVPRRAKASRIKIDPAEFTALWAGPMPTIDIAKKLGVSQVTVCRTARRLNLPNRHDRWIHNFKGRRRGKAKHNQLQSKDT